MTRSLGIDIGSFSIKIAEIQFEAKAAIVLGMYELPYGGDLDSAKSELDKFFKAGAVNPERVNIGLGNVPLLLKRHFYPWGDRKKVEMGIRAEFEDFIPYELDEFVLDFRKLGKIQKSYVYLSALCPRKNLDALNACVEGLAFLPHTFSVDSEMLARFALSQLPAGEAPENLMICDIGYRTTKLAIVRSRSTDLKVFKDLSENVLELRTLNKGSYEIFDWMSANKNLAMNDVEQWLLHRARIKNETPEEPKISDETSDDLKTALKPILVEIYQTMQSIRSRQGIEAKKVLLTGGISHLNGFKEFFSKELRIEAKSWDCLSGFDLKQVSVPEQKKSSFTLAVALAEAFRPSKMPPALNFRRSSFADRSPLSGVFDRFSDPGLRPILLGLALSYLFFLTINLVSSIFVQAEKERLVKTLVTQFLGVDPVLGKRAPALLKNVDDAKAAFDKEVARFRKNAKSGVKAKSDLVLDLSLALSSEARVLRIGASEMEGQGTKFEAQVEMPTEWNKEQKESYLAKTIQKLENYKFKDFTHKIQANRLQIEALYAVEEKK